MVTRNPVPMDALNWKCLVFTHHFVGYVDVIQAIPYQSRSCQLREEQKLASVGEYVCLERD